MWSCVVFLLSALSWYFTWIWEATGSEEFGTDTRDPAFSLQALEKLFGWENNTAIPDGKHIKTSPDTQNLINASSATKLKNFDAAVFTEFLDLHKHTNIYVSGD